MAENEKQITSFKRRLGNTTYTVKVQALEQLKGAIGKIDNQ